MFTKEDIEASTKTHSSSSGAPMGEIYVGKTFEDKIDLKTKAALFAMKNNFQYMVKKSGTNVWYITCKDPDYCWRLRGKKLPMSPML